MLGNGLIRWDGLILRDGPVRQLIRYSQRWRWSSASETDAPAPWDPIRPLTEAKKGSWLGESFLFQAWWPHHQHQGIRGFGFPRWVSRERVHGRVAGDWPPKAVSEPPAGAKYKPFTSLQGILQESTKYLFVLRFSLVPAVFHVPRPRYPSKIHLPFECTSFQPSADLRQLLISSAESELSFRSQLCPKKWQEDSVIFSL